MRSTCTSWRCGDGSPGSGSERRCSAGWRGGPGAHGKPYLRLDTDPDNPEILAYYERHGFQRVGDAVDGDLHVALLQRHLDPDRPRVNERSSA